MKNLDHVKIEQEETSKEPVKNLDEHEWSCDYIHDVAINNDGEVCFSTEIVNDNWFNDEDLAVLVNARGFDMVEREEG